MGRPPTHAARPAFMIRFLIIRFVFPIILFVVIRTVLRSLALGARQSSAGPRSAPSRDIPASAELKKDPVCGTYVSTAASLTRTINGKVVHFCSEECLHKYRAA